jgi:hypothetical protein
VRLAQHIFGHSVDTAVSAGFAALNDGDLLDRMAGLYDVLVTVDKCIQHQQRLATRSFAVVILRASTNRFEDLLPLVPRVLASLETIVAGVTREIELG